MTTVRKRKIRRFLLWLLPAKRVRIKWDDE